MPTVGSSGGGGASSLRATQIGIYISITGEAEERGVWGKGRESGRVVGRGRVEKESRPETGTRSCGSCMMGWRWEAGGEFPGGATPLFRISQSSQEASRAVAKGLEKANQGCTRSSSFA